MQLSQFGAMLIERLLQKPRVTRLGGTATGNRAKSYAVKEWSSMHLIDKQGTFVASFADDLPEDEFN
jgi:hypothetical protein